MRSPRSSDKSLSKGGFWTCFFLGSLTQWLLHQTVCDPPLISECFLEYSRASESTKFNFELVLCITIFFSKVQAAAWPLFKTHLTAHWSCCFCCSWRRKKLFTRKVWGLYSPRSSILRPPKHRFLFFLFILNANEAISLFRNENKTLEVCRFGLHCTMITFAFLSAWF